MTKNLVLDAMGVLYVSGDDVPELLCPFIHEHGGETDDKHIEAIYRQTSFGRLTAQEFWREVGIDLALEDEYLKRHRVMPGLIEFLRKARPQFGSLWCLSNDVAEWSLKLRERFDLTCFFDGFVISGDVKLRKPDPAIFKELLRQSGLRGEEILFVDDRIENLDVAAALGFETTAFGTVIGDAGAHPVVRNYVELAARILSGQPTQSNAKTST